MNDDEFTGKLVVDFIQAANMPDRDISYGSDVHRGVKAVVEAERERCAEIVQSARDGERDSDLRSIIYAIKNP